MISLREAGNIVQELYDNRKAEYLRPRIVQHLEQVGEGSRQVAAEALERYPGLPINIHEIALAGALHDVGRFLHTSQAFHEIRGYLWLRTNIDRINWWDGDEIGARFSEELFRIPRIMLPHSVVAEQFDLPENETYRKEFARMGVKREMLVPRYWQQAIVSYTDLSVDKDGIVGDFEARIGELLEKSNDPIYAPSNPTLARGLELGMERIKRMCGLVERLREGKLSKRDFQEYRFL